MSPWGGTQNFWDGGGQPSMGGDKVFMGGGPGASGGTIENPEYLHKNG